MGLVPSAAWRDLPLHPSGRGRVGWEGVGLVVFARLAEVLPLGEKSEVHSFFRKRAEYCFESPVSEKRTH